MLGLLLVPCVLAAIALAPPSLRGQATTDRTPNLSGDWVVGPGTVQFNFLHRFVRSPGPQRKVTSFPTFLVTTSVLRGTMVGFNYSTNSTVAPGFPNEWEFFARARPLSQAGGALLDVGAQVGWNVAADGPDGELSLARRLGPVRLLAVGRALSNPDRGGKDVQWVLGGGAVLRLTRALSLEGDLARRTGMVRALGDRVAWSAGLAVAIPNTPHTISLHATNTNSATLQGASRGARQVRYGFEFTVPITLSRYFGHRASPVAPAAPPAGVEPAGLVAGDAVAGPVVRTGMENLAYRDANLVVAAGTTVEWRNGDQLGHSVTADGGAFDSGVIDPGGVWRYTFTRPGVYPFHCTPHPFMRGTITVK
jgi:plastocyanin